VHVRAGLTMVALALVLAPAALAGSSSAIVSIQDLGTGSGEVWAVLPEHPPECIVVYIHATGDLSPARYLGWLDYLAISKKCAVVFPRYQAGATGPTPAADLPALRKGLSVGLNYVRKTGYGLGARKATGSLPVIAAGVGYGGTLAFYYAAYAKAWGLPVPVSVDSMFPVAGANTGLPKSPLAPSTNVLIQVGDRDRVGGKAAGQVLWKYLASHSAAKKHYVVVHSSGALAAVSGAPVKATAGAETAFWPPLDNFIDTATAAAGY
jgi:pimeloyl-ACP methyl ester carboxylesterase